MDESSQKSFCFFQVFDWVMYVQQSGFYPQLNDEKNFMCSNAMAALRLDGEVSKTFKRVPTTLDSRQIQESNAESNIIHGYNQISLKCGKLCIGDYVELDERLGKIEKLFIIGEEKWADISFYDDITKDRETHLRYANTNTTTLKMSKLVDSLKPIVVAMDGETIWFLTPVDLDFYWLDEHVSL